MGRRSKAEMLNLVEKIISLYEKDKLSFDEIAERIADENHVELSREAVRRAYNKADAKAQKYRIAAESARSIIEAAKGTNMELAEAANSLVSSMFYERILQMDGLDFESDKDFFKALAPVMNNQSRLASARLTYENGRKKALDEAYDEIAGLLGNDDKLMENIAKKFEVLRGRDGE